MYRHFLPCLGHCVHPPHSVQPFICPGTLGWLPRFGYCDWCCCDLRCMKISVRVSSFSSFGHISRSRIVGSHGNCVSFFEELPYYFPQKLYHLTFLPARCKGPISPYPCQYLVFSGTLGAVFALFVLITAILTGRECSLIVILKKTSSFYHWEVLALPLFFVIVHSYELENDCLVTYKRNYNN